jgi:hypothetical protein
MPYDSDSAALAASPHPAPVGDRRGLFVHRLATLLRAEGITLVSAELGSQGNLSIWMLGIQPRTRQVLSFHGTTPEDPLSEQTCTSLAQTVIAWVRTLR